MHPQPSKNTYNGPPKSQNNTAQNRTNQSSAGKGNRQHNFSTNTPRNRLMPTTAIFPPLHGGVVMGQFNPGSYPTRTVNIQQCQFGAQIYSQICYPLYVPQLPQQQQQQHQNANAATVMGVMNVQPGTFVSRPAGNQANMTFAITPANSLLNVANSTPTQSLNVSPFSQTQTPLPYGLNPRAKSYGTVPTINGSGPQITSSPLTFSSAVLQNNTRIAQVPQRQPRVKAKLRTHALEVIHPITNKNVLQDLNNDQEIMFPPAEKTISQIQDNNLIKNSKSEEKIQFKDSSLNRGSATNQIFELATQQPKQITKHDVCVEIIPIQQNSISNSVIKQELPLPSQEMPIPKNVSLDSALEQDTIRCLNLAESNIKDKFNQLALEEICITTNAGAIPGDAKVILKPGSIEQNLLEPEEKLGFDHSKFDKNIELEAMISQESQDFTEDKIDIEIPNKVEFQPQTFQADVQIYSFTRGITQETKTVDQFENSKTLENVNSFTVNDDPEENYIEEELLISRPIEFDRDTIVKNVNPFSASEESQGVYCKEKAIPLSHKDRKKYSRKQLMELRQCKQSCKLPEVKNFDIFAHNNLMPAFVGRSPLNRPLVKSHGYAKHINKCNYIAYPGPESTILDSTNDRYKSKPMIYLNLALNQDVQLNEAHNAWKPRVLTTTSDKLQDNFHPEKAELIRKVRGILNKLTPEKFDPLVEEILKLKIDNLNKMEAVMNLVFEKAIDEPNFSVSYARLCHRLIEVNAGDDERMEPDTKSNLAYFRKALLDKTEREFTHYVAKINAKEESLKPLREKYENCQDKQEQIELEALLNEEERKIRRRSGGTVRFIGELFKISILSGRIIHSCIEALLKDPQNEDMLECLCKLLSTVGQKFEQTVIHQDDQCKTYSLKSIIKRMQRIATRSEKNKISSRIRFMLLDVIDLRKKKWQSTRDETPQTMQQIEKDINDTNQVKSVGLPNSFKEGKKLLKSETIIVAKRLERANGLAQNDVKFNQKEFKSSETSANEWQVQTTKSYSFKNLDSSKLGGLTQVDLNNKKMGAASFFQWKKSCSQPQTLGTNSFAALSSTDSESHRNQPKILQQVCRESERGDCLHSKSGGKEMVQAHTNSGKMRCNEARYNSEKGASTSLDLRAKEIKRTNPNSSTLKCRKDTKPIQTKLVFNEPSSNDIKIFKSVLTEMMQNAMNFTTIDEDTVACITRLEEGSKCPLLYYVLTDYLHLCNIKSTSRNLLSQLVIYLIENKYLNLEHFQLAYTNFIEQASDLIVDIPELWLYIFEFTGPFLVKNLINFNDLWQPQLRAAGPSSLSQKFLKSFIQYTSREVGPNFMRSLWQKNHLKWSDFMDEKEIENFIQYHEFAFIENVNEPFVPKYSLKETPENLQKRVKNRIQHLLKEGCHPDLIMDYINGNILQVNRTFIHNLSASLVQFCLEGRGNCKLDLRKFHNISLPLLRRYLNSQEDLELECLKAIYALMEHLELSESMWESICSELSAADVIAQETFDIWHNFKEP